MPFQTVKMMCCFLVHRIASWSVDLRVALSDCGYAETLGGNCLTTMIGTVRQGEWDRSLATLKHLVAAQQVSLMLHLKQISLSAQQLSQLVSA